MNASNRSDSNKHAAHALCPKSPSSRLTLGTRNRKTRGELKKLAERMDVVHLTGPSGRVNGNKRQKIEAGADAKKVGTAEKLPTKADFVDGVRVKSNVETTHNTIVMQSPSVMGAKFTMPTRMIRSPDSRHLAVDPAEYDLDSEDEEWLAGYNYDRDPRRNGALQAPLHTIALERAMTDLLSCQGRAAKPLTSVGIHHKAVLQHFRRRVASGGIDYLLPKLQIGTGLEEHDDAYACFTVFDPIEEPMAKLPTPSKADVYPPAAQRRYRPRSPGRTTAATATAAQHTTRTNINTPSRSSNASTPRPRSKPFTVRPPIGLQIRNVNVAGATFSPYLGKKKGIHSIGTNTRQTTAVSTVSKRNRTDLDVYEDGSDRVENNSATLRMQQMLGIVGVSSSPAAARRTTRKAATTRSDRHNRRLGRAQQQSVR